MKTLDEIRRELKHIRYFYLHRAEMEIGFQETGGNLVLEIIKAYNKAIYSAEPKLYHLYISLYHRGLTQEAFAAECNYEPEYIDSAYIDDGRILIKTNNKNFIYWDELGTEFYLSKPE